MRKRKIKFCVLFFLTSCRIARWWSFCASVPSSVKWVQHSLPIPFKAVLRFKQTFWKALWAFIKGKAPTLCSFNILWSPIHFFTSSSSTGTHMGLTALCPTSISLLAPPTRQLAFWAGSTEGWAGLPSTDICPVILDHFFPNIWPFSRESQVIGPAWGFWYQ